MAEDTLQVFEVECQFVFKGKFRIVAADASEAATMVNDHCGLVMGGDIHTTMDDEQVDWNFDTHPEKVIGVVKQI